MYCIIAEMVFMFFYIVLVLLCWNEWSSQRQHLYAWLLLLTYVFFWGKTSFHFAFNTFGAIARDTQIKSDNPIEESYNLGGMSALLFVATVYSFFVFRNEHFHVQLFAVEFLAGAFIHFWHFYLLKSFHTEPDDEDLDKFLQIQRQRKEERIAEAKAKK